jgi:hypothetical protein
LRVDVVDDFDDFDDFDGAAISGAIAGSCAAMRDAAGTAGTTGTVGTVVTGSDDDALEDNTDFMMMQERDQHRDTELLAAPAQTVLCRSVARQLSWSLRK